MRDHNPNAQPGDADYIDEDVEDELQLKANLDIPLTKDEVAEIDREVRIEGELSGKSPEDIEADVKTVEDSLPRA